MEINQILTGGTAIPAGDDYVFTIDLASVDPSDVSAARFCLAETVGGTPLFTKSISGGGISKASNGDGGTLFTITIDPSDTADYGGATLYLEMEATISGQAETITRGAADIAATSLD